MTCRIDRVPTEQGLILCVSGRIAAEDVQVVRAALDGCDIVAIDIAAVELVDGEAVRLLTQIEAEGIELRNCAAYIREWITKERKSDS